jgi:NhaA family Na+:H+ antiporter
MGFLVPPPVEGRIHPWVAFGAMPMFALANLGLGVQRFAIGSHGAKQVLTGVVLARLAGKPAGVLLGTLGVTRAGISSLPREVAWRSVLVVGCLAGIGLTVPIYIAGVAFPDGALLDAAKLGLLLGSGAAAIIGLVLGVLLLPRQGSPPDWGHQDQPGSRTRPSERPARPCST